MSEQKKYSVTFNTTENNKPIRLETEVIATSEADAIEKAKIKLSVDREGENYKVICSGAATPE